MLWISETNRPIACSFPMVANEEAERNQQLKTSSHETLSSINRNPRNESTSNRPIARVHQCFTSTARAPQALQHRCFPSTAWASQARVICNTYTNTQRTTCFGFNRTQDVSIARSSPPLIHSPGIATRMLVRL